MSTNIRNPDLQGVLWNWKPVADLLPGKLGVSDIDGVCERKGHFLFMESKHPDEKLSLGQEIMLKQLAGVSNKITVVVVYGDRTTGEIVGYQKVTPKGLEELQDGRKFRAAFRKWFKNANG